MRPNTCHAFIDGANLHKGVTELGWKLDYRRFRVWLKDKFNATNAYIFLGLIPAHKDLYEDLQEMGYILVYKEVTYDDYYEKKFDRTVIVSSDGDYAGLVKFLKEKGTLDAVISPSNKCSYLLRKLNVPLVYLDTQRKKLDYKSNRV